MILSRFSLELCGGVLSRLNCRRINRHSSTNLAVDRNISSTRYSSILIIVFLSYLEIHICQLFIGFFSLFWVIISVYFLEIATFS